jgi:hypothetical protein
MRSILLFYCTILGIPFARYGKSIVEDVHHEEISLLFMHQLNTEFNGQLDLSIQVFKGLSSSIYVATHFESTWIAWII